MEIKADFITQQKLALLAEKKRVEEEIAKIAEKDPKTERDYDAKFPDYGTDEEENAQEEADYDANKSVEKTLEAHLKDIGDTLRDIESGKYGLCSKCGKEIAEERLRSYPAARRCIDCSKG